jgi:uncharacterized phiE125 gp8 family phage protein
MSPVSGDTVQDVKRQSYIDHSDDDGQIERLIAAARDHAEHYCGTRLATQTIVVKCDCFADLARLPTAPVQSITSITYLDAEGATATLSTDVYELRADGLDAAVVLKYDQTWPAIQQRSRITVTAVVGYADLPPAIKHAMLLWVGGAFENRENAAALSWTAFDSLLCNFRRGA